ncbi:hypothetical protein FOZ61_007112 [Perkinsus olseni]|nr:hypothetical protein FOZ61_007112 [Perkinsus olseni]
MSFMVRLALMSTEDTFKEFMAMTKKFGKICCFKTPTRQVLVVSDMPTYRSVMKRRPREFSKPDYENIMDGVSMATAEGDVWKKHRKISSRPLTETNVNKLLPMITRTTQKMVRKLEESADEEGNIVWHPEEDLRQCASIVVSALCMAENYPMASKDPLYGDEIQAKLWGLIGDSFAISMKLSRVFYHDRFLYKLIFPGLRQVSGGWWRNYCQRRGLDAPCFLAEADSIGEITPTSIHSMPYIEACALDALRLNPSVPVSINKALVDTEVAGKTVKAGTQLIFLVGQMMRENYDEGDKFIPERWLSADGSSIDGEKRSEFIAFGFGPRQCPGRFLGIAEIICSAALFLQHFDNFSFAKGKGVSPKFSTPLTTLPQNLAVTMQCRCNIGA